MIAWKPTRFIFVHIPKCAGTSIEQAFLPFSTSFRYLHELPEDKRTLFWLPGTKGLQHAQLRHYERRFNINHFFKFAFVRNPWDRAISQIEYLRLKTKQQLFMGDNFKKNLKIYCNTNKNLWGHDLGACQSDYLFTKSGNSVDFVGKFESLTEDFKKICGLLQISPIPKLPWVFNSKRSAKYCEYYDSESIDWIKSRFKEDIDRFDYKFDSFSSESQIAVNALPVNGV